MRDEIRAMASFKHQNLMGDLSGLGKFDVIFCRNVAIYFSEPDKISLFRRIERAMEPNGYLVIGAMESLNGLCPQFEPKRHLRSVYYQVKENR
jgi:chemotaxis protein methyltransferase CheR